MKITQGIAACAAITLAVFFVNMILIANNLHDVMMIPHTIGPPPPSAIAVLGSSSASIGEGGVRGIKSNEKDLIREVTTSNDQMMITHRWTGDTCESEFISKDNGENWEEIHKVTKVVRFKFKKYAGIVPGYTKQASVYKKWAIGIFDESRDISISLYASKAFYSQHGQLELIKLSNDDLSKDDMHGWELLCPGNFLVSGGRELDSSVYVAGSGEWQGLNINPKLRPPPAQFDKSKISSAPFMLLIAAYRDELCGNTLMEAFQHAKYPDRITVGVVQQKDDSDVDCVADYCTHDPNCRRNQVRVMTVPLNKSRGVMPGRYRQHLLIDDDQEFCLQTDSHMVFPDEWDMIAIQDWLTADNEMAVMTTYPNKVSDRNNQHMSPARCSTQFSGDKQVVHGGNSAINMHHGPKPILVPFFGAGISMSKCHAFRNVPYDPYMGYLFGGEEFNRASRLWTWGYDLYAPRLNYAYHFYDSEDKKPAWIHGPRIRSFSDRSDVQSDIYKDTVARWRAIYGLQAREKNHPSKAASENIDLLGLGCRRSIRDYLQFAGVNLKNATLKDRCQYLGKMPWVAWDWEAEAKAGGGIFHPSGPECALHRDRKCITTLDLIRNQTITMLETVNVQLHKQLRESEKKFPDFRIQLNEETGIVSGYCANAKTTP